MTTQLRKAIMRRSWLKSKANKNGKPVDKTVYKTQINLVSELNKEAKKSFLKNQRTENATNKTNFFLKKYATFSHLKRFSL